MSTHSLLAFAILLLVTLGGNTRAIASGEPAVSAQPSPRIATVDWTIAETLMALKAPPAAMAQIAEYHAWVEQPALPDSVVDLGLRAQPNRELAASLDLDLFLLSPLFAALEPSLSEIAPVTILSTYRPDSELWQSLLDTTRQLGKIVGKPARAEQIIEDHRQRISQVRESLPAQVPQLLIVQFIDNRHVRVYGEGSLYNMVLERLGITNAWQGGTNLWGYATAGLEELIQDGYLVVVDPMPMGVEGHLETNSLWNRLPSVRANRVVHLPAVWSFGALPSAVRFAEELGHGLGRSLKTSPSAPGPTDS